MLNCCSCTQEVPVLVSACLADKGTVEAVCRHVGGVAIGYSLVCSCLSAGQLEKEGQKI